MILDIEHGLSYRFVHPTGSAWVLWVPHFGLFLFGFRVVYGVEVHSSAVTGKVCIVCWSAVRYSLGGATNKVAQGVCLEK